MTGDQLARMIEEVLEENIIDEGGEATQQVIQARLLKILIKLLK